MNSDETPKPTPQKEAREPVAESESQMDLWATPEEQNATASEDVVADQNENNLAIGEVSPVTNVEDNQYIEGDLEPVNPQQLNPMSEMVLGGASYVTDEATTNDWLIEGEVNPLNNSVPLANDRITDLEQRVAELQSQEQKLKQEIANLQASYAKQSADIQNALSGLLQEGLKELEQRKQTLQIAVEQLERRQERIRAEMKTSFAGVSQDLAIRVQGFKDYLVGSLQDLASAAEQLELVPQIPEPSETVIVRDAPQPSKEAIVPQFAEQGFQEQAKQIRKLLDQYRTRPDYYGPPWQLRRTFEPIHAERASYWFFSQGGKGALRTMGSRLQNTLIASSIISVLRAMYGDRLHSLILANSPERLGEWRRGLQDCLGVSRGDFGPDRGLALFEAPEPLAIKAERLVKEGEMPLIIIDETEDQISLSVLQFPLWLAFAPDPQSPNYSYERF